MGFRASKIYPKITTFHPEGYSLTDQVLDLLPRGH